MQQPDLPLFLLDNMLNPKIAEALRLVGYNIRSVEEVFGNRLGGVKDPEIIEWCAENSAVWLTADIAAKRRHEQQTKLRRISVVWYHSPKQGWSTMEQHRIITKFLQRIANELASGDVKHFRVGSGEKSRLRVEWRRGPASLL